jgi:hypothetical protein
MATKSLPRSVGATFRSTSKRKWSRLTVPVAEWFTNPVAEPNEHGLLYGLGAEVCGFRCTPHFMIQQSPFSEAMQFLIASIYTTLGEVDY